MAPKTAAEAAREGTAELCGIVLGRRADSQNFESSIYLHATFYNSLFLFENAWVGHYEMNKIATWKLFLMQ